jgi:hypothetical protein
MPVTLKMIGAGTGGVWPAAWLISALQTSLVGASANRPALHPVVPAGAIVLVAVLAGFTAGLDGREWRLPAAREL